MKQDNFCYYPFTQMLLQPTGEVSPCCWNQSYQLGEVKKDKLLDIWNAQPLKNLRKEFLDGNPVTCKHQMKHMECHKRSVRDFWKDLSIAETMTEAPQRLDLRLNGKCNLRCTMCEVWSQPNGVYDQSDFWTNGKEKIFPFIKEIDVLGGEPFIQKDTYRLINEVHAVNPSCQWSFVTNGQFQFGGKILEYLNKIQLRFIQLSMDSLDLHSYQNIRLQGNFEKMMESANFLVSYRKRRSFENREFLLYFSFCIQRKNWTQTESFLDFSRQKKVVPILQFAYGPNSESLLGLNRDDKKSILKYFFKLKEKYGKALEPLIKPIEDSLSQETSEKNLLQETSFY